MKGDLEKTGRIEGEPNRTYVSNATYASHGPVNRMQLGGLDRYYQAGFNARLQATSIQFGTNAGIRDQVILFQISCEILSPLRPLST